MVVETINKAVPGLGRRRGLFARGGSLDVSARETAEACDIDEPEALVKDTVKAAVKSARRRFFFRRVLEAPLLD